MRAWRVTLVHAKEQDLGCVAATAIARRLLRCWLRLTALALVCACLVLPQPAAAQQDSLTFRQQSRLRPSNGPSHLHRRSGDPQMHILSDRVDYDYADHQFAAVGNVQIYYNRATIEADRVVYDQITKRLRAVGNARLTEANGKVTIRQFIDLTDYYRDGFVDALGVETAAPRRAAHQPQRRSRLHQ